MKDDDEDAARRARIAAHHWTPTEREVYGLTVPPLKLVEPAPAPEAPCTPAELRQIMLDAARADLLRLSPSEQADYFGKLRRDDPRTWRMLIRDLYPRDDPSSGGTTNNILVVHSPLPRTALDELPEGAAIVEGAFVVGGDSNGSDQKH